MSTEILGAKEIIITGLKGDKGDKGDTPVLGVDYNIPEPIKGDKGDKGEKGNDGKSGKDGLNGKDGKDGLNGKDGNDGKDGSPDTPEQIKEKLETLEKGKRLDYNKIDNAPDIDQIIRLSKQSSKTVSLRELDDVILTNVPVVNGKYDLGAVDGVESVVAGTGISVDNTDPSNPIISATGSGTAWGSITGTLSNQTDLQTVLDTKATKAFAVAMAISLG